MAFASAAIIAGAAMSAAAAGAEGNAALAAGAINAQNAEASGRLAKQRAADDEKQFRLAFRRDQGSNLTAIATSGIRLEGSALDVLRENSRVMEEDATNIRLGGLQQQQGFSRGARLSRFEGKSAARAAGIRGLGAAANLLKVDTKEFGAG